MIEPRAPRHVVRRIRYIDSRLRLRFDSTRRCWAVEEWVGAWGKWSCVLLWRDPETGEPRPLEGAADAICQKLRQSDWSRFGQRKGALAEINREIDGGASVGQRDIDEERYWFKSHVLDLYQRQIGLRKTFGPGPITRLDSKAKSGYLDRLARNFAKRGR